MATKKKKPDPGEPVDTSNWLTRQQATQFAGCGISTLIAYERRGLVHPRREYRTDTRGAERITLLYDPSEVLKLPRRERVSLVRSPGETTARACELFREGRSIEEVVVELRETFERVEELHDKWGNAGGADRVIVPAVWEALEKLVGPFKDVTGLLERLVERLGSPPEVKAPVPRPTRKWVVEILATGTSRSDVGAAAGSAVGPAVELTGAGAAPNAAAVPDASTTKPSANDEGVAKATVGDSDAATPSGIESVSNLVAECRALDGDATTSSGDAANGVEAAADVGASGTCVAQSPRELLLDEFLHAVGADDARLPQLGELLTPAEKAMLAELAATLGIVVAVPTGARSPREQVLDALLVKLTADPARHDQIRAILTPTERDMLARLVRGLPECDTPVAIDEEASLSSCT